MAIKKKPIKVDEEKLREEILLKEDKKEYSSAKFQKIEDQVKLKLKEQKTDEALRDITIGALVLNSSDIHYEVSEK
jgi:transcriptional regulator NrdR family protein